jgi:hypothetical protein
MNQIQSTCIMLPDEHFDYSSLFSDAQVEKVENSGGGCENWKSHRMKTKQSAMKLSQIRRRIGLCLTELILRFEMNLQNILFSWQFNSYSYSKASTDALSNWAVETLGD